MLISRNIHTNISSQLAFYNCSLESLLDSFEQDPQKLLLLWRSLKSFRGKLSRHRIPLTQFNKGSRSASELRRFMTRHSFLSDVPKELHEKLSTCFRNLIATDVLPYCHLLLWRAQYGKTPDVNGVNPFHFVNDMNHICALLVCSSFRKKFIQLCNSQESYILLFQGNYYEKKRLLLHYDPLMKQGKEFSLVEKDQEFISQCENFWYLFADAIDTPFDISPFIPQS